MTAKPIPAVARAMERVAAAASQAEAPAQRRSAAYEPANQARMAAVFACMAPAPQRGRPVASRWAATRRFTAAWKPSSRGKRTRGGALLIPARCVRRITAVSRRARDPRDSVGSGRGGGLSEAMRPSGGGVTSLAGSCARLAGRADHRVELRDGGVDAREHDLFRVADEALAHD